ncbi:GNAT family N-acetyltransferase [Oscillatoria acuminata]|uniref:Acetyltransferase n=1 Tax=Oscillatoria acuminata PCC 6304 TaxID=56110 RepID=K9TMJ3_9CYAN|nr:GNAT family N-acetyltransferase [Oscillatoria acuminata]AFY83633.1 acetyltransferase [Oscillatoria acuminata PCC 6304]
MSIISRCPVAGETDLQQIADLVKTCEVDGLLDEDKSIADLKWIVTTSSVRSRRLWKDSNGHLRGFGQLWIPEPDKRLDGYLWFYVDPQDALQNSFTDGIIPLETEILDWAENRLREIGNKSGLSIHLHTKTRAEALIRISTLERHNFSLERTFLTLVKSDLETLPTPEFPSGFNVRSVEAPRDNQAWVDLYNESFIDHWDHHDLTLSSFQDWQQNPNYQPEFDLVAVAPDGTFAALCQSSLQTALPHSSKTGWIRWLGTRRGFRRMGLGRSILLAAMERLYAAGATSIKLGVDADSATGATRLYDAMGFRPVQSWLSYVKTVTT